MMELQGPVIAERMAEKRKRERAKKQIEQDVMR
jgi:hypothetical protein